MQTVEVSRCITSNAPLFQGYFIRTPAPSIQALPEVAVSCITLGYFLPDTPAMVLHNTKHMLAWQKVAVPVNAIALWHW